MNKNNVATVVIVLNYNDYQTCINFINETKDFGVFDKIILVDNCSTDNSVEQLRPYINDKISLVEAEKNLGYAYGNNIGMRFAIKNYPNVKNLIISNPDIHVSEGHIKKILAPLDEGYGMSTGVIYNYNPRTREKSLASNFGWRIPDYGDMISNCYLLSYKIKRSIFHTSMYFDWESVKSKDCIEVEAVPGCFFALNAQAAKRIDYLDEETFLFGEETILGWRLKKSGYKACIVNGTEVLHENSVSINKNVKANKIKERFRLDAEMVYIRKYLNKGKLAQMWYELNYKIGLVEKRFISRFI